MKLSTRAEYGIRVLVALAGTNLAEAAMAAGGPPYPMAVRRQRRLTTAKEQHDIA